MRTPPISKSGFMRCDGLLAEGPLGQFLSPVRRPCLCRTAAKLQRKRTILAPSGATDYEYRRAPGPSSARKSRGHPDSQAGAKNLQEDFNALYEISSYGRHNDAGGVGHGATCGCGTGRILALIVDVQGRHDDAEGSRQHECTQCADAQSQLRRRECLPAIELVEPARRR